VDPEARYGGEARDGWEEGKRPGWR
jgi:hypothetical protein